MVDFGEDEMYTQWAHSFCPRDAGEEPAVIQASTVAAIVSSLLPYKAASLQPQPLFPLLLRRQTRKRSMESGNGSE